MIKAKAMQSLKIFVLVICVSFGLLEPANQMVIAAETKPETNPDTNPQADMQKAERLAEKRAKAEARALAKAATDKARKDELDNESLQSTNELLAKISISSPPEHLKSQARKIENTWLVFAERQGKSHPKAGVFSLLRARALTATRDKSRVVDAWKTTIELHQAYNSPAHMMNLFVEAGDAASSVKNSQAAKSFYQSAQDLSYTQGKRSKETTLQIKAREISLNADTKTWRQLNEELEDLRTYAEQFALWSVPQLDALLTEAFVRFQHQPQRSRQEFTAKRMALSEIQQAISLNQKSIGQDIPPVFKRRIRDLMYLLEDNMNL